MLRAGLLGPGDEGAKLRPGAVEKPPAGAGAERNVGVERSGLGARLRLAGGGEKLEPDGRIDAALLIGRLGPGVNDGEGEGENEGEGAGTIERGVVGIGPCAPGTVDLGTRPLPATRSGGTARPEGVPAWLPNLGAGCCRGTKGWRTTGAVEGIGVGSASDGVDADGVEMERRPPAPDTPAGAVPCSEVAGAGVMDREVMVGAGLTAGRDGVGVLRVAGRKTDPPLSPPLRGLKLERGELDPVSRLIPVGRDVSAKPLNAGLELVLVFVGAHRPDAGLAPGAEGGAAASRGLSRTEPP